MASQVNDMLALGRGFVHALEHQAWGDLAALLDPAVQFRGLVPHGLREAKDRAAAASYLQKWFGDADQLVLESSQVELMHDRVHITYRFRAHEDQWYIVEQHAYCTIVDGYLQKLDVLCSGFRPVVPRGSP